MMGFEKSQTEVTVVDHESPSMPPPTRPMVHLPRAHRIFANVFKPEAGIRDYKVTGVQTCALPISTAMTMFQVTAVVSTTVTILVAPFFIAVVALLYAFAVRRPLGLPPPALPT